MKKLSTAILAFIVITTLAILFANTSSQFNYVQIPVPTDVTPPLGHGYERLRVPDNSSSSKQHKTSEPVQVSNLGSMSFRHLDNTVVRELSSGIDFSDGEVVVTGNDAHQDNQFNAGTIASQLSSITLGKDNIVQTIIDKTSSTITIRSLHKETTIQLDVITVSGHTPHQITLRDGQEITLPIRSSYRTVYLTAEQLDKLVMPSDFVTAVKTSPVLQRMRTSTNKNDRRIYNTAEKTAAVIRQLH